MSGAISWQIYVLVQLQPCIAVVHDIVFLEVGFNSGECISSKSTIMKNILSVIRTLGPV